MFSLRFMSLGLMLLPLSFCLHAESLKLGIFPYLSAQELLSTHQPVARYLSEKLGQRVDLISAPDFSQFISRTRQKKYDLILTAPHMGALAMLQSEYQPLAVSNNRSHAVFITLKQSRFASLSQAQNASFTLPPEQAIISKLALNKLSRHNINIEDLDILYTNSHNNAAQSVLNGDSEIAAIGLPTWGRLTTEEKLRLRIIARTEQIPGFMILANPNMATEKAQQISHLLHNFSHTKNGQFYFKTSKLQSFRNINYADIEQLTPFVESIFNFTKTSSIAP